jgi:DNA-binding CsgD family transcriptional regulator
MPRKSTRLTAADVRAVFRLVNECRDLGSDPDAWPHHLSFGLTRLVNAACVAYTEAHLADSPLGFSPLRANVFGDLPADHLRRYAETNLRPDTPEQIALTRFWATPGAVVTCTRRELLSDEEWERSAYRNEVGLPFGLDDGLVTRAPEAGGAVISYALVRAAGDPPYGPWERRLVDLFQVELAPHLGRRLATVTDPAARLTARQRQVLDCLLDGDSEKQVALRLGLAAGTVHVHVKRLYALFGVSSRAELLAYFLRRYRRPS